MEDKLLKECIEAPMKLKIEELQKENKNIKENEEVLKKVHEAVLDEMRVYKKECNILEKEKTEFREHNETLQKINKELRHTNLELNQANSVAVKESQKFKKENEELTEKAKELLFYNETIQQALDVDDKAKRVHTQQVKIENYITRDKSQVKEIDDLRHEIARKDSTINNYDVNYQRVLNELNQLKSKPVPDKDFEKVIEERNTLADKVFSLERDVDKLKKHIVESVLMKE